MNPRSAGTMLTLREATATHHRRAEQHEFQRQFVRGGLPRSLYLRWLSQMLHIHATLESHLDRLVTRHPALKSVYDEGRRKVPGLQDDLTFLGGDPAWPPLPAARALITRMAELAADQPLALLGIFYVLEGSTNGSKFIARKVRPAYDLPATGEGSAYLDPYGDMQPARWQEFKAAMDAQQFPATEVAVMVAEAQATFDAVHDLGGELLAAASDAAA